MKYQVLLRGANFQVAIDSRVSRHGFLTTRFVEADTPDAAEHLAVGLVRRDPQLQAAVRNDPTDPPMIYLDSLAEIASFDGYPVPGAGYSWFPDDGQDAHA